MVSHMLNMVPGKAFIQKGYLPNIQPFIMMTLIAGDVYYACQFNNFGVHLHSRCRTKHFSFIMLSLLISMT